MFWIMILSADESTDSDSRCGISGKCSFKPLFQYFTEKIFFDLLVNQIYMEIPKIIWTTTIAAILAFACISSVTRRTKTMPRAAFKITCPSVLMTKIL